MKVRAIAANAFSNLLRNKLIWLFCAGFLCVLMLFMTPLLMVKSAASTLGASTAAQMALSEISVAMTLMSGFGSLLAAWAAADAAASEVRSGTILAVLARPVRRWEFLLSKYIGVMTMMTIYSAFLLAMTYLLTAISGHKVQSSPVQLVAYLLARYAIYAVIGMLLGLLMHPALAFGAVLVIAQLASMAAPGARPDWMPAWIRDGLYVILPSTHLLSEDRFLQIAQASIRGATWTEHLTSLTYGLDYAAVCFLLAVWAFRRKSLTRE